MSEWISATEASKRIKAACLTEEDLIEWARLGKLKARAQKGTFSDDDPGIIREFPKDPPSDEIKRSVAGSWPDIPADFWEAQPHKALWGAGTFAASIRYWNDYYQSYEYEYVELFDLTFSKVDLDALLTEIMSPPVKVTQSSPITWQPKQITPKQRELVQYFETPTLYRHFVKQGLGAVDHHLKYCEWARQVPSRSKPFKRTAFDKWKKRYDEGCRIDGRKWVPVT
jgi:hypothetical protein